MMIIDKINALMQTVSTLSATDADEVEQLRLKYLSKKGEITALMAEFRAVPADMKKEVGMKINELKQSVQAKINELKEQIDSTEDTNSDIDLTCTAYPVALGARHPLTIVKNEIIDIFSRMGFTLADGPEIDDDLHVFTKLNFAADHPARDMQDTFFIEQHPDDVTKNILLRSHTSGDQSHYMENHQPPIRIICPGRVYRADEVDATHSPVFHQMEGLVVDENVSMSDLRGTLEAFAKKLYGSDVSTRFRPSFFPFTEPSAEVDISCCMCGGKGHINGEPCRVCKTTGWVEILGCGMVDPAVFASVGYPADVSGFAFGLGVERVAMLKYGIGDLRMFFENDVRFLGQFGLHA